jgi:hypothetical protein
MEHGTKKNGIKGFRKKLNLSVQWAMRKSQIYG